MDYVIIHDQRDGFCPPVSSFQVLQQTDKQHRTFAVATYIADFTRFTVQCPGQVVFFILPRRYHAFLLPAKLPVCTDFWIEMDIHFIVIKDRMFCTAFVQRAVIFSSLCGSRIRSVGTVLRHTSQADGSQRRTVPASNRYLVISLIFIASNFMPQRER